MTKQHEDTRSRTIELVSRFTGMDAAILFDLSDSACVTSICTTLEQIAENPESRETNLASICPSTTFFNRNMIGEIVYALCQRNRAPRVLSAGCSTGAEAYSIAMYFAEGGRLAETTIVGIDVNPAALRIARKGAYYSLNITDEILPIAMQEKYLPQSGEIYTVAPELRDAVRFEECSVLDTDALTTIADLPFDVITCRNILKYFPDQNIEKVMYNLRGVLSTEGVVLLDVETERRIQKAGIEVKGFQKVGTAIPSYVGV
ncbi:methyltransferase domain-containing protein [Candidatus Woesearchaeota archaeon]|nr:methyltransferase domain-containing protein [Candidatus Woesearchaeota archaeon]